jgi:hypothetical protein
VRKDYRLPLSGHRIRPLTSTTPIMTALSRHARLNVCRTVEVEQIYYEFRPGHHALRRQSRRDPTRLSRLETGRTLHPDSPRFLLPSGMARWAPPSTVAPDVSYYKAPSRKWHIVRDFNTADDCEDSRSSFFEHSRRKVALNMLEPAYRDFVFAECIATDDPRQGKIAPFSFVR